MKNLGDNSYSIDDLPNYVKVGRYSSIATGVRFHARSEQHRCKVNRDCVYTTNWDQPGEEGEIKVGNDVWIGEGVRILPDVTIGDGAIIGAGAVIGSDVAPFAVVVGNPGKINRFRFTTDQMTQLLNTKWWNLPDEKVELLKPFMQDIKGFLVKLGEFKEAGTI